LPPAEAGEAERVALPPEGADRNDDGRPEGGLLAAARHALVLALASQVGLAWAGWGPRRRKGTE
jgi:hypothetical protein